MWIVVIAAVVCAVPVVAALAYRAVRQRRVARAARIDTPDGIVEGRYVTIGGVEQWLQIRGEDRSNPVLLVVHGGPGSPYSVFTPVLRSWERHFTVVHWDRRGAGRTLRRNGRPAPAELTFDRMVEDGIEVAEFLRTHLEQDRVVLMAGSMGTLVGLPMAHRRPDLFSAYVGTDFYANMLENEAAGHRMAVERARAAGDRRALTALERIGGDPTRWDAKAWGVKMQWSMASDPVTPDGATKLLFPLLLTKPDYSLLDVWHFLRGFAASRDDLYEQFIRFDASTLGTRFEVPFFLFQGDRDVVTLTGPAEEYFATVEAPAKALVLIEDASHFCAFVRPEPFLAALLEHVRPVAIPSRV